MASFFISVHGTQFLPNQLLGCMSVLLHCLFFFTLAILLPGKLTHPTTSNIWQPLQTSLFGCRDIPFHRAKFTVQWTYDLHILQRVFQPYIVLKILITAEFLPKALPWEKNGISMFSFILFLILYHYLTLSYPFILLNSAQLQVPKLTHWFHCTLARAKQIIFTFKLMWLFQDIFIIEEWRWTELNFLRLIQYLNK